MTDFVMENLDLILLISVACGIATAALAYRYKKDPLLWFFVGGFFGLPGVILTALYLLIFEKKPEMALATSQGTVQTTSRGADVSIKTDVDWYYLTPDEETKGPYTFDKMKSLFQQKTLSEFTLVWNESLEDWSTIASLTGLEGKLSE